MNKCRRHIPCSSKCGGQGDTKENVGSRRIAAIVINSQFFALDHFADRTTSS